MIAAALEITPATAIGEHWIYTVEKDRLPFGPADLFDAIPLSTEPMGNQVFVIYRDMPKGSAVAAHVGNQWQKWVKA